MASISPLGMALPFSYSCTTRGGGHVDALRQLHLRQAALRAQRPLLWRLMSPAEPAAADGVAAEPVLWRLLKSLQSLL